MWNTNDPREVVEKRARIIIDAGDEALIGNVDVKHTYAVFTNHEFDRYKCIGADTSWPSHWRWMLASRECSVV